MNITQLMIFSNNMEYDTMGGIVPVQGAFYCTTAKQSAPFNCFREENPTNLDIAPYNADFPYKDIDPIVEKKILTDFNCQVIHTSPEYQTNLDAYTPTNRVLTSMCSPERLLFILKYGIAYVRFHKEINGKIEFIEQKHIMRYQQMFAALTVRSKIDEGVNSGVIWHTQGSGKTALSYYLTYVLSDYFSKQNKVAKFYFIVDRLDLLKQASEEFEARGLVVKTASSRAELMEQFRNNQAQEGNTGKPEITVVNIQRFAEDRSKVDLPAYATNLQRVFIIDEAHRGYKPEGSFLANLLDADKNVSGMILNLGGSSVMSYGSKPDGSAWQVAVTDPRDTEGDYLGVVTLNGTEFLSTSGDYEKYFIEDGVRYHHILDPATGYPARSGLTSVTVVCDDGLNADGLSTACFVLGKEKAEELLKKYNADGLFVDDSDHVWMTEGMKERFQLLKDTYSIGE